MDAANWIQLGILALGIVVAFLGLLWWFTQQIAQERRWREEADRELDAKLAAFQLEATRTFATSGAIEKSEERLAVALDKLSTRLEAAVDKLSARLETVIGRIEARDQKGRAS